MPKMSLQISSLIRPAVKLSHRRVLGRIFRAHYGTQATPSFMFRSSSLTRTFKLEVPNSTKFLQRCYSSTEDGQGDKKISDGAESSEDGQGDKKISDGAESSEDGQGDKKISDGAESSEDFSVESGLDDCTLRLTEEEVETLTKGDPQILKQIRYIQLEHEVLRQSGVLVPTKRVNLNRWEELLLLDTQSKRKRFYSFLFKLEKTRENDAIKKQEFKQKRKEYLESQPKLPPLGEDPDGMIYGLNRNTLTLRLRESTESHFYHGKLIQEMIFGQPLVFDLGYMENMSQKEAKNCAKQLELCFHTNRDHKYPFNMYFCNATPRDDYMLKSLHRMMPRMYDIDYPINVTDQSYLDIFPRENLVYLSPHAKEEMAKFDHDTVYIIGGMVDKSDPRPFSLAKAKRENIKTKKLPIDTYLDWGFGNKSLTLDQMLNILLDLRFYKDWNKAFRHIPRRKLKNFGKTDEEDFNYQLRMARGIRGTINPPEFMSRQSGQLTGSESSQQPNSHPRSNSFNFDDQQPNSHQQPRRNSFTFDGQDSDFSGFQKPRFKSSKEPQASVNSRRPTNRLSPDLKGRVQDN